MRCVTVVYILTVSVDVEVCFETARVCRACAFRLHRQLTASLAQFLDQVEL